MKVVVVEDQALFREFLVNLLRDKLSHDVVGFAADGPEALRVVRETDPDLVILDILIPKLSGIHVARCLIDERPGLRILALSSETDLKTVHQVHQLRLSGFIDKNEASVEVLRHAIDLISQRKRYVSANLTLTIERLKSDPKAFQKILTRR